MSLLIKTVKMLSYADNFPKIICTGAFKCNTRWSVVVTVFLTPISPKKNKISQYLVIRINNFI